MRQGGDRGGRGETEEVGWRSKWGVGGVEGEEDGEREREREREEGRSGEIER